ncbi:MAG: hypothetical protein ACYCVE_08390, partial [Gemmatimonadaceae bacterium]
MTINRRKFVLRTGGFALAATTFRTKPLLAQLAPERRWEPVPPAEDPQLKALAQLAVDAARQAGASYADVRLSHAKTRSVSRGGVYDSESVTVGVRALVSGYWGFASGPVLSPDELVRLGGEAVHQAKVNALGEHQVATLAPAPPVADGHWTMPVSQD